MTNSNLSNVQNNANNTGDTASVFRFLFKHLKPNPARITILSSRKYEAILSPALEKFKTFEQLTISLDNQVLESERMELERRYTTFDIFNMHDLPLVQQDLIIANPPFTEGVGKNKKQIYGKFLELAHSLIAKNGQALFILPANALNYKYRHNKYLSNLFNVKKVFFLTNNAGFDSVRSRICAVVLEALTADTKPATELWVDDTYVLTTNQFEMIAPFKDNAYERDLTIALSILYKVFDPNNLYQFDQLKKCELGIWDASAMSAGLLDRLKDIGASPTKYEGCRLVALKVNQGGTSPYGFANSKAEDFDQLNWFLSQSKIHSFISQMFWKSAGVYQVHKACISKDWKMLTSDELINEYYGFTKLEINYINETANNWWYKNDN